MRRRVVVFSGHRIDAPDRGQPRFPPASEPAAAEMIRTALRDELALAGGRPVEGIAGGASGGDILFHELCAERGIPSRLLLALPPDEYARASVQDAGPDWVERFRELCRTHEVQVLGGEPDDVWQRSNRWLLESALSVPDAQVTLMLLWDGEGGDGPGGTRDMVRLAQARGVRVVRLDAAKLR